MVGSRGESISLGLLGLTQPLFTFGWRWKIEHGIMLGVLAAIEIVILIGRIIAGPWKAGTVHAEESRECAELSISGLGWGAPIK